MLYVYTGPLAYLVIDGVRTKFVEGRYVETNTPKEEMEAMGFQTSDVKTAKPAKTKVVNPE